MGHIFQQTYTVFDKRKQKRITKKTKKWYAEYRDANGDLQRVPGYRDKRTTEQMLAQLEKTADQQRAGILPKNLEDHRRQLSDLLNDFVDVLRSRDSSQRHIDDTERMLRAILKGCRWKQPGDMNSDRLASFLKGLRSRKKKPLSTASSNHYLTAAKAFSRWIAERLHLPHALAPLRRMNTATDRRRVRRALSDEDFARLLSTTEASSAMVCGFTGVERARLYLLAAYTGFRASELASIKAEAFSIQDSILVVAGYSKRRREDRLPLHPDVAKKLAEWIATRPPGKPLWNTTWAKNRHAADMLKHDLPTIGQPYQDSAGLYFDFHALRHQFVTALARAGVHPRTAQALARHSDINLTMKAYTHLDQEELAKSLKNLPKPP